MMRNDKTLRLNFFFFIGVSLFSIILVIHRIIVNDHPYFLIDTHERMTYGIDYVILNKSYYDMLMVVFYSSIIMDSFFTYLTFKEFADMTSNKKYRDRIYARKIIFALSVTCISTSLWAFFFFSVYRVILSTLFACTSVFLSLWKAWLSHRANIGIIWLFSLPIITGTVTNFILSVEAINVYDGF